MRPKMSLGVRFVEKQTMLNYYPEIPFNSGKIMRFRRYGKLRYLRDKIKGVKDMFFRTADREELKKLRCDLINLKSDLAAARHIADVATGLAKNGVDYYLRASYFDTSIEDLEKSGYEYKGKIGLNNQELWIKPNKSTKINSKSKAKKKKK